jgi:hypothetical protein
MRASEEKQAQGTGKLMPAASTLIPPEPPPLLRDRRAGR